MDVSGWTLAKRMKIPDQYFPNRQIVSAYKVGGVAGVFGWAISGVALPDPACIWEVGFVLPQSDSANNYFRVALRGTVPTTEAEMNGAINVFPDLGDIAATPPKIYANSTGSPRWSIKLRKGFVTGGNKLVLEIYPVGNIIRVLAYMVVSGLPTNVPAWAGVA